MQLNAGQIYQLDISAGEILTVVNEGANTVYYGTNNPNVSSTSNTGSIAAAASAAVTGPAWIVCAAGPGQVDVEYAPAIIPAVAAASAQTGVAVATTAATNSTPYGYSQTQADAIRVNLNAATVDIASLYAAVAALTTALNNKLAQ